MSVWWNEMRVMAPGRARLCRRNQWLDNAKSPDIPIELMPKTTTCVPKVEPSIRAVRKPKINSGCFGASNHIRQVTLLRAQEARQRSGLYLQPFS